MSISRLSTFQGETLDGKKIEGDLIHLDGFPYRFIQNEEGGNQPIINGSEKIKLNGEWVSLSE
jgi:hypothetical protein